MRFSPVLAALAFATAITPLPAGATIAPETCLETLHVTPTGIKGTTAYVRALTFASDGYGIWHKHTGAEIVYVTEGSITVQRKGKADQTLAADQSILVPAGTIFRLSNKSHTISKVTMTFIGTGGVSYIATGKEKEPFKPCSAATH